MESEKVKVTQLCPTLCNPIDYSPCSPWDSSGQNTGVGSLSLFQGIFQSQELNLGLLNCRQVLYHLSHQGNTCRWKQKVKDLEISGLS